MCKQTVYRIGRSEVEHASTFCWLNPQDDGTIYHHVRGTFLFVAASAILQLRQHGYFVYDGITWRTVADDAPGQTIHVRADIDGTEMWLCEADGLWLVQEMRHNPLGIDWTVRLQRHAALRRLAL